MAAGPSHAYAVQRTADGAAIKQGSHLPRSLFDQFRFECRQCTEALPWGDEVWEYHIESWLAGAKTIPPKSQISALQCTSCQTITCIGCGGEPKIDNNNYWTSLGVINHCCDGGRLFGISLLLYRFDQESTSTDVKTKVETKPSPPPKLTTKYPQAYALPGVGYAAESDSYGYDPYLDGDDGFYGAIGQQFAALLPEHGEKDPLDPILTNTLKLLLGFLQSPISLQLTCVSATISASRFLDHVINLARNDSIDDMTQRQELYLAMFDFMRQIIRVGSGLADLAFQERPGQGGPSWFASCRNTYEQANLFLQLASKSDGTSENTNQDPKFASLAKHDSFRRLFLGRTNSRKKASDKSKSNSESVTICKIFLELYQEMAQHPVNPTVAVDQEPADTWIKFWQENKLTFSDEVANYHRLYRSGTNTINTPARNRSTAINKEIANMRTSLPEGIFVKVDESRTDIMKVLIVGVEGTPYAGGLFTFDLLLDQNYPVSPPKMHFVLEGVDDDNTAVNPNLHVGGQVCLSLLNTWDGTLAEMWQPNKSTILAVLVSVQAMILGAAMPYMNEPGVSILGASRPEVKEYTLGVQCKTVKYAMIQWLKKLETKGPSTDVWKEVSAAYWKYNSENVLAIVTQWAAENPRLQSYVGDDNTHNPFAHAHEPHHGKRKSKGKKKAVDGENLVGTLSQLIYPDNAESVTNQETLQIPIPVRKRASEELEEEPAMGKRQKTSNSKLSKSNTDIVEGIKSPKPPTNWDAINTPNGGSATNLRWYYNGPKKMVDIRKACDEFGVQSATSIQRSIERLEAEFNDENESEFSHVAAFGNKWGEFREA